MIVYWSSSYDIFIKRLICLLFFTNKQSTFHEQPLFHFNPSESTLSSFFVGWHLFLNILLENTIVLFRKDLSPWTGIGQVWGRFLGFGFARQIWHLSVPYHNGSVARNIDSNLHCLTWMLQKNVLLKKGAFILNLFCSSRAGPIGVLIGPYGPEKSHKIRNEIAFIGAFKVPCTLP